MAAPWLPRSRAHCFELYLRGGGTPRESDEREMPTTLCSTPIGSLMIEDWVSLKINRYVTGTVTVRRISVTSKKKVVAVNTCGTTSSLK